jgi:UDP-4-amino-4,6-dideoxy-N-acetyl-beta-L-altrosamine transaminase
LEKFKKIIPYSRQDINQDDIDLVSRVLHSDWLTQGPMIPRFENAVTEYVGSTYGVAVNSSTSALHIACLALDVGPGDWVWTSPNTFVASANCALYCGAKVDFVDIDLDSYNICVESLAKKLKIAKLDNKLPKVLIPVHFAGQPCDMNKIYKLSQEFGFKIIEDASHAIGASYNKIKVGSCTHSHITVFSFHPVKIITTGEGGMATTNDLKLFEKMSRLRTHGITKKKKFFKKGRKNEIWNYQQIELGFNYRLTDIQAALGISQLTRINDYVKRRQQIAYYYNQALKKFPVILPWQRTNTYSSYHLYPIRITKIKTERTQKNIYNSFIKAGINVNLHYIPVYRHPFYETMGFKKGYCPVAEQFYNETISLPIFPTLNNSNLNKIVKVLINAF